jgi:spore maturation protein SpmB
MAIDKLSKSNRLLQSRRYTHDSFTDSQEAFTSVLDINANEVYIDQSLIPTASIPYSGSTQSGLIYSANGQNVMQYYWRQPLTRSNLSTGSAQNEVWFFLNPSGSNAGIGAQLIDSTQQTNFISPKYATPSLANATTEDTTTGYLAKVFVSNAATASGVSAGDAISVNNYTFDYKTGVLQFTSTALAPTSAQYVYVSVYQYKGRLLTDSITNVSQSVAFLSSSVVNINAFTASENTKFSTLATYTGSIDTKFSTLGTYTASVDTKFVSIGASTSSLNAYTASADTRFSALQASTASLNVYTQSNDTLNTAQNARLTALETTTGSNAYVSQSIFLINNYTGSAIISQSVVNGRLTALEIASSSLEFFTSSQNTKNSTLATYTGSIDTKWSNLAVYTGSIDTKFGAIQSSTSSLNLFTSSILTALTASGVNITTNGSLTVKGDLIIQGSSSVVNSTTIQLGDNIIELNGTGVANGGLLVKDPTGGSTVSGSLLWDSTLDYWKGGTVGNELKLLRIGSDGVVSGSGQISLAGTSDYTGLFGGIAASTASLNIFSASANIAISNLNTYTGSVSDPKFASIAASTSSLNTFTASLSSTSQVTFGGVTSSFNIPAASVSGSTNTKRLAFRDTTGKLELVPSASVAGDFPQWDGGSFIMSNIIDGGSF